MELREEFAALRLGDLRLWSALGDGTKGIKAEECVEEGRLISRRLPLLPLREDEGWGEEVLLRSSISKSPRPSPRSCVAAREGEKARRLRLRPVRQTNLPQPSPRLQKGKRRSCPPRPCVPARCVQSMKNGSFFWHHLGVSRGVFVERGRIAEHDEGVRGKIFEEGVSS